MPPEGLGLDPDENAATLPRARITIRLRPGSAQGLTVGVCRVHFLRNVLAQVPRGNAEMVAAAIRTIFAQPDAEHVHEQFETIAGMLGRQLPKVEQMLRAAQEDLLAFTLFPASHWKKIWSTISFERLTGK